MKYILHDWTELKSTTFSGQSIDLLLGNGFSRRYSERFAYASLFDVFLGNCNPKNANAFKVLGTDNFEEILDFFTKANELNACLRTADPRIDECIEELKNGLIKTVNALHPYYGQLNKEQLVSDVKAILAFSNVFTTNYDLILYHLVMLANDQFKAMHNGQHKFQDNFSIPNGGFLGYGWEYEIQCNVHYLHGSLILFMDDYETTYKIRKRQEGMELLESVDAEIRKGNIPLFVSEGHFKDKEERIRNNSYLEHSYIRLRQRENPILVFGHALHEKADGHILTALFKGSNEPIIVAIRGNVTDYNTMSHMARIHKAATDHGFNTDNLHFVMADTALKTLQKVANVPTVAVT